MTAAHCPIREILEKEKKVHSLMKHFPLIFHSFPFEVMLFSLPLLRAIIVFVYKVKW